MFTRCQMKDPEGHKALFKDAMTDEVTCLQKVPFPDSQSLPRYLPDQQLTSAVRAPDTAMWLKFFRALDKDLKNLLKS